MEGQSAFVEITVNGDRRQIPSDQSVAAMLSWLQLPSDRVAVELNRRIVRKRDWEQTLVPSASQIEVVEFVGGG
jgi:thiamine biosynthesis protein ThiS